MYFNRWKRLSQPTPLQTRAIGKYGLFLFIIIVTNDYFDRPRYKRGRLGSIGKYGLFLFIIIVTNDYFDRPRYKRGRLGSGGRNYHSSLYSTPSNL